MTLEAPTQTQDMTHEEAVRRAWEMVPRIRERALRCDRERKVPRETIDEFVASGLGRIMTPKRWGGYEISHDACADVILAIGEGCGSTAWCCSWLLTHVWWFMAFPLEAQADVYGNGPDVNLAASFAERQGKAIRVPGGYRLSGRWKWTSGVDHCSWSMLGAIVVDGDKEPDARILLVPDTDYRIEDTWYNVGLRGTGSNDVIVDDVFVPEHRSVRVAEVRNCTAPGRSVITGPMFRLEGSTRNHELIAPALGAMRGAFKEWLDWSRNRVSHRTGAVFVEDHHRQLATAQVETDLDAVEMVLRRNLDLIRNGGPIDPATITLIHYSGTRSIQWLLQASDVLLGLAGAAGLFDENPIQRAWRDVKAISAHGSANPFQSGEARGRVLFGMKGH
jgi:3-hydroxy-9,10-secoandrosta-1,3,5(10)-triene-9,17-dione monooxygenase